MPRPLIAFLLVLGACTSTTAATESTPVTTRAVAPTSTTTTAPPPTTTTTSTTTTTTIPIVEVDGEVAAADGTPLPGSVITSSIATTAADDAGAFTIQVMLGDTVTIERPAWLGQEVAWDGTAESLDIVLEPRVVNALRVSRYVSMDPVMFAGHLDMAANSSINALIFDTKDETGQVLYNTAVAYAGEIGAVEFVYDPADLIAQAKAAGLYTVTRVVSFEDPIRVVADPETKLRGNWVDMTDPAVWEYPLDLGTEACELGFDEIQFDYVRFPAGLTGAALSGTFTAQERIDTIKSFLAEAVARIHPLGCAVSADVFGIIFSSPTDEGIGQRVEELSAVVDVISPMLYPSHYSIGWLGFGDPNDHPGPVIADALDQAQPRLAPTAIVRPWLQAFYYVPSQILDEIAEAEQRGWGWMLWNAGGNYSPDALPAASAP